MTVCKHQIAVAKSQIYLVCGGGGARRAAARKFNWNGNYQKVDPKLKAKLLQFNLSSSLKNCFLFFFIAIASLLPPPTSSSAQQQLFFINVRGQAKSFLLTYAFVYKQIKLRLPQFYHVYQGLRLNLSKRSKMIIFGSLMTAFEVSSICF